MLPLLLGSSGCAAASAAWRAGPAGIAAEWAIRDHLTYGRPERAWEAMGDKELAPNDALLRHMYRGVIALHAGHYEAGSRSMDRAWQLVDDRFTKRVSTAAASLVTSDATLPYIPGTTEQLFIPYYGALNWLARNELDEVAVEARRLVSLLAREDIEMPPNDLRGSLHYVAGVLFEAAGDRQDALVAYRNAAAYLSELPGDTTIAPMGYGDVVVLLEDGFVGRPEPQSLGVYMNGDELVALTTGDNAGRLAMAQVVERRMFDPAFDRRNALQMGWLTYEVNWASFGAPSRSSTPLAVRTNPEAFTTVSATVTDGVQQDFQRDAPERLARALVRTAVRYAALRAAEKSIDSGLDKRRKKKDGDDDGGSGWGSILLGIGLGATSLASAAIDQPDLRAWQVLPDRITIARLRLPVGEHPIEVLRGDEVISLGAVTVRDGGVAVLTHRWWPGAGAPRVSAGALP